MDWRVNRDTSIAAVFSLAGVVAFAGSRSVVTGPAAGTTDSMVSATLPWWKKSLAHTVQEEWLFAQQMDSQFGPRWRTALPDKSVAKMYLSWFQTQSGNTVP